MDLDSAQLPETATANGPCEVESVERSLGPKLVELGKLDKAGLERAVRAHEESGERIDRIFARLGIVGERDIAEALAAVLTLPFAAQNDYPEFPLFADDIGGKFVRHNQVLPVAEDGGKVWLAMADPLDAASANAVALRLGLPVGRMVAVPAELENALERLYGEGKSSIDELAETFGEDGGETTDADIARLRDLANEAPVIRIVNLLIRKAVEAGASDIHIEPFEARLRVRYRIDGVLQDIDAPPARLHAAILSRLKIMAKLNIAENRLPQDGRIQAVIGGKEVDLRVATTPLLHGEGVVLRILDREALKLDLPSLGFAGKTLSRFRGLLHRPNGIVLVTGPTGSGKTTTLYASLMELNSPDRKVVTVEDPVEYQIAGVNQIQAKPKIGLTFAHALRSILRQDPDVIMIGEIRDLETAKIAVQAALTGHLVLATLHTNTASATISRLLDMGVEDYLLASTLNGVIAQRLVRRLCAACRQPDPKTQEVAKHLAHTGAHAEAARKLQFYKAGGCPACGERGYRGRTALVELLEVDDAVRKQILSRAEAGAIEKAAVAGGMQTMQENGILKGLAGECSLDEIIRVTNTV